MSENTRNQSVTAQLADKPTQPYPRAIDPNIDRLIDDVFADVDRALERSQSLPEEPLLPKTVSLNPIQIPPIVMRPLTVPRPDSLEAGDEPKTVTVKATQAEETDKLGQFFDRFLIGTACVSLLLISALWIWSRDDVQKWVAARTKAPASPTATPEATIAQATDTPKHGEYVQYMERSLERINPKLAKQNAATSTATAQLPAQVPPAPPVPTLTIPFNPNAPDAMAQSLGRIASALERIPLTANALRSPQPAQPANASRPTPPQTQAAAPRPAAAPTAPAASTPAPAAPEREPDPEMASEPSSDETQWEQSDDTMAASVSPTASEPETAPEETSPAKAPAEPQAAVPDDVHTLIGFIQNGEDSAALFEVNGSTTTVSIGEGVGSSGWSLVEVTDQQAVMRRNGEVRSIYVGQQF
jgi:hypothetical protein